MLYEFLLCHTMERNWEAILCLTVDGTDYKVSSMKTQTINSIKRIEDLKVN